MNEFLLKKIQTFSIKLCLSVMILLFFVTPTEASHFRGSNIAYNLDASNNLTVTVYAVWRSTFIGGVNVRLFASSDTNRNTNLLTMTETSVVVVETGFEFPGGEAFTVRKHVFKNDISAFGSGWYAARWEAGNRVAAIANVGNTRWGMETLVDYNNPGTANNSPVMLPATIDMIAIGLDWSQNLLASDPDATPISYQFIFGSNNPQYGTDSQIPGLTIDSYGQLNIPSASTNTLIDETRYAYKIRVTDSSGSYSERDVLVVARNLYGNNPPVLSMVGNKTIAAGNNLAFDVFATDIDTSDNLTMRMASTPAGSFFTGNVDLSPISSSFTWNNAGPPGIYQVSFEVFDRDSSVGTTLIDSEIITITVMGNNKFPVLDPIGNQYTPYPGTLTFTVTASDFETSSANLIFTASFLPPGATFNTTTRVFSWTPTVGQQGVWTGIVFRVTDDDSAVPLFDEEIIAISVNANQSPNLNPILTQTIDISQSFNLIVNSTDPNGDNVTLTLQSQPGGATFSATSGVTATANLFWTPPALGTYLFGIRAIDDGLPNLAQDRNFNVTVIKNTTPATPTNLIPTGNIFLADTTPDLSFFTSDPEGDNLSYQIQVSTDPSFSSLSVDYTSSSMTQGNTVFTIGQAAGTGTYVSGSSNTILSPDSWYWRVRSFDTFNWASDYSTSGNSSIAFIINSTPAAPQFISPIGGVFASSNPPVFQFSLSDPDNNSLYYQLQVSSDSGFNSFDIDVVSALASAGNISTNPGTLNGGQYYWRVQSTDSSAASSGLAYADGGAMAFIVDDLPLDPRTLSVSTDHGIISLNPAPTFSFYNADNDNSVRYRINIAAGSSNLIDFTSSLFTSGNQNYTMGQSPSGGFYTSGNIGQTLASGSYTWTVQAISTYGRSSNIISGANFTINSRPTLSNLSPNSPADYFIVNNTPTFSFDVADPESDLIQYSCNIFKQDSSIPIFSSAFGTLQSTGNISFSANSFADPGNYYWTLIARDAKGSDSTISLSTGPGFIVLSAPPVSNIISPVNNISTDPGLQNYKFAIDDPSNLNVRWRITLTSFPSGLDLSYYEESANAVEGTFNTTAANLGMNARGDYNWKLLPINTNGTLGGSGNIVYSTSYSDIAFAVNNPPSIGNVTINNSFVFSSNTFITSTTPDLSFTASDTDPDPLKYTLIIDDSSDFSTPLIQYTSPIYEDAFLTDTVQSNLLYHWGLDAIETTSTPSLINTSDYLNITNTGLATGKHGRAFNLNKDAGALSFTATAKKIPEFSFSAWINPVFSGNSGTYLVPLLQTNGFTIRFRYNAGVQETIIYWGSSNIEIASNTSIGSGNWSHLYFSGNNTNLSFYVNDSLIQSSTINAFGDYQLYTDLLTLGSNAYLYPTVDSEYYNGLVDEIRIYDRELSSSERSSLHNIPTSVSSNIIHTIGSTGNSNNYTVGTPATTLSGGQYYFKAYSTDPFLTSSNVTTGSFIINTSPSDASNFFPTISQTTTSSTPFLSFSGSDPEGGSLRYRLRVSANNDFSTPLIDYFSPYLNQTNFTFNSVQALAGESWISGSNTTELVAGRYNWDIQLYDSYQFSSNVVTAHSNTAFIVNNAPPVPSVSSPINSSIVRTFQPSFIFYTSDPDGSIPTHTLTIDNDSNFSSPELTYYSTPGSSGNQTFTLGDASGNGTYSIGSSSTQLSSDTYFWKIDAADSLGGSSFIEASTSSSGYAFRVNSVPNLPVLISPIDGSIQNTRYPTFSFTLNDLENDSLFYTIEISSNSGFTSKDIVYQSSALSPGSYTYTTSDAGTYTTGNANFLLEGSYYWRLSASDNLDSQSVQSIANGGNVAFIIETTPLLSAVAEINPGGATQSTISSYQIDFATIHSTTSHGFDRVVIQLPSGFSTSSNTLNNMLYNGSSNLTTTFTSGNLIIQLSSANNTTSQHKFNFELNNPNSAQIGTFNIEIYNSLYNERQTIIAGDGDQLSNGGSLSVQIQSAGAALMALSEILPILTTQASVTDFTFYTKTLMDSTTSGIDVFSITLPEGYSLFDTSTFTNDGTNITYTTSINSGNRLDLALSSHIGTSGNIEFKFSARAPLTPVSRTFTANVQTAVTFATTIAFAGDGDSKGDGGTLSVSTQSVGPVLSAVAEVFPDTLIKGSGNESFQLFIYAESDPTTSGVDKFTFTLPNELSSPVLGDIRFAGSTIAYTSSFVSNTFEVQLSTAINLTGVYSFDLNTATAATVGSSSLSNIILHNTTLSSALTATLGDGKQNGFGDTLSISRIANGPANSGFAEIFPRLFIKGIDNQTALHLNINVTPQNSGFNRIRYEIPSHIEQTTISGMQWNGTSIAFTADNQSFITDPAEPTELAHIYYIKTTNTFDQSGVLTIFMDVLPHNEEAVDSIAEIHIAESNEVAIIYTTSATIEQFIPDGDGDNQNNGGSLSFEIKSDGPASDTLAEVLPILYTKGTEQTFNYYLYPTIDIRHDGVNVFSINLGNDIQLISFLSLKRNGVNVIPLSTSVSGNTFSFLTPLSNFSSVFDFSFKGTFSSTTGTYTLPAASIDYTTAASIAAYTLNQSVLSGAGDGDHLFDGGTLTYKTQPAGPALNIESEILPNKAIKASNKTFSFYFYPLIDAASSGVDTLTISMPNSFGNTTLIGVKNNGIAVSYSDSSQLSGGSPFIQVKLNNKVTQSSVLEVLFNADLPINPISETFGFASVDDSSFTFPRAVVEGDGDHLADAGSLKVDTVAKAVVISAKSEVTNNTPFKAKQSTFIYHTSMIMDAQTSGVKEIILTLPFNFTNVSTIGIKHNGATIAYTSSSSGTDTTYVLQNTISTSSSLSIEFSALMPAVETRETLPGLSLKNGLLTDSSTEGDGDAKGDGGSLVIQTIPTGPAVRAFVEVLSSTLIKGESNVAFSLFIHSESDLSTSGADRIVFKLPTEIISPILGDIRFNGSTIAYTSSVSNNQFQIDFISAIDLTGVYELEFLSSTAATEGSSAVTSIALLNVANASSTIAEIGDGDNDGSKGTTTITRIANGPATSGVAEINPHILIKATENNTNIFYNVNILPQNGGFDRIRFEVPSSIKQSTLSGVLWNGTSIAFEQDKQTYIPNSGNTAEIYYIKTGSKLTTSGVLNFSMQAYTEDVQTQDNLINMYIAYSTDVSIIYSTSSVSEVTLTTGDGDNLGNSGVTTFDIRSAGPASDTSSELQPSVFTKGVKQNFNYYIYPTVDLKHNGVNYFEINLGNDIHTVQPLSIQRDGSTLIPLSTSVSANIFKFITPLVDYSSVLDFSFEATFNTRADVYNLLAAKIDYTTATSLSGYTNNAPVQSTAGDGDHAFNGGSLQYKTLPSGPALDILSEITPNKVIKSASGKNFSYFFYPNIDPSSSGVNKLSLQIPNSFTSATITNIKKDGASIAFTDTSTTISSTRILNAVLANKILDNSVLEMIFTVTSPINETTEKFGIASVDDTSFNFARSVTEGDGDQNSDGGSLSVSSVSKAVVISARSELNTNSAIKGSITTFTMNTSIKMDSQTSGVKDIVLNLPFSFTNVAINNLKKNGSNISYTSSSSGTTTTLSLNNVISDNSIISIEFLATMPSYETRELIPGLVLNNGTLSDTGIEGDGNDDGISGSLAVQTVPSGPAAEVIAEINPNGVIKSSKGIDYILALKTTHNISSSHIKSIQLSIPHGYSNFSLNNVQVNGSSISYSSSAFSSIIYTTLTNIINTDSLIEFSLKGDSPLNIGKEAFQPITLFDTTQFSLRAIEGVANPSLVAPHTWSVRSISAGAGRSIQAEIMPTITRVFEETEFTYFINQVQDASTSPVKRITLELPISFTNISLLTVQVTGASVGFSSTLSNTSLEIILDNEITETEVISVIFKATPQLVGSEKIANTKTWYLWNQINSIDNVSSPVIEGDGDNSGPRGSNSLTINVLSANSGVQAYAEISPNIVASSQTSIFKYSVSLLSIPSSGVDRFSLELPDAYSNAKILSIQWRGSSVIWADTSSNSISATLNTAITEKGVLAINFEAQSPTVLRKDKFSLFKIGNASSQSFITEGDGDEMGGQGANSLAVETLLNPPAASALTEIFPNHVTVGVVTEFDWNIGLIFSTHSGGVQSVDLKLPDSFTVPILNRIHLSNQSIHYTSSVSNNTISVTLNNLVDTNNVLNFQFESTPLLGFGTDTFPLPVIKNATSSMSPTIGDTDNNAVSPSNDLSVAQHNKGPVQSAVSEVTPTQVIGALTQKSFTHHTYVVIGKKPSFTGFDTIKVVVPKTYSNISLVSVKIDGSSVYFTNQSNANTLQALLQSALLSDEIVNRKFVVSLSFIADTPNIFIRESFSNTRVHLSSNASSTTKATQGDGEQKIFNINSNSWTIQHYSSLPVEKAIVEVYPNQFILSNTNQAIDLYLHTDIEKGNSGIDTIEISIPSSLSITSQVLTLNGLNVGTDLSDSKTIRYKFSPAILFDGLFKLSMKANIGSSAIKDQFSNIKIIDSNGTFINAIEGDGDQSSEKRGANSWGFEIVNKKPASRIESSISPRAINVGIQQEFNYIFHVQLNPGDSGFDTIKLGFPSQLSSISYVGVYVDSNPSSAPNLNTKLSNTLAVSANSIQFNGTAISGNSLKSSSTPSSTTGLNLVLNNTITSSSVVEIRFNATVLSENNTPIEFSQFSISNSADPSNTQSAVFDDSNSWGLSAYKPRAVLQALAEISPNLVLQGNSKQTFSYYIKTTKSNDSGYNRIQFSFPVTYSNFEFVSLQQLSNSNLVNLNPISSINGTLMTLSLPSALTDASLKIQFRATVPSLELSERFSLVDVYLASQGNLVQVEEGNSSMTTNSTHSLKVDSSTTTLIGDVVAEVDINSTITPNQKFNFSYQAKLSFPSGSTGIDYLALSCPNDMVGTKLRGFRVNGQTVLYEDGSYYTVANFIDPVGSTRGGSIVIKLPVSITTDSSIELFLETKFRPAEKTISLSQFMVSKMPIAENTQRMASEGDGGNAAANSWSIQLLPPFPGIRHISDYPLLTYNSGDYATPTMVGFGNAGERVIIRDNNATNMGNAIVDDTGFFIAPVNLLNLGSTNLYAQFYNLAGNLLSTSKTIIHSVIESVDIPTNDLDLDGSSDFDDIDDDNDGIVDIFDRYPYDTDNDGIPNSLDSDDDNDGVSDIIELAQGTQTLNKDSNADGINDINSTVDSDADGIIDSADNDPSVSNKITDSDLDGEPDFWDIDDDGDGILDNQDISPYDADNDGLHNLIDTDDDNDGLADTTEISIGTKHLNRDSNGDGIPDSSTGFDSDSDSIIDSLDTVLKFGAQDDLDFDGITDISDTDTDGDGIENDADNFPYDYDNDGSNDLIDNDDDNDGIIDSKDKAPVELQSTDLSRDSDNDGIPNHLDPDDDNDRILDINEGSFSIDANADQNVNAFGQNIYYSDRDGVTDILEYYVGSDVRNADTNGDGKKDTGFPNISGDNDNDGIVNAFDPAPNDASYDLNLDGSIDSTVDYIQILSDSTQSVTRNNLSDSDADGINNFYDSYPFDTDNDMVSNVSDSDPDGDGINNESSVNALDSDNDGIKNILEIDADNDKLLDSLERILASDSYKDTENSLLRPDQLYIDLSSQPKKTELGFINMDWSRITGSAEDNAVPQYYKANEMLLPIAPIWKVNTTVDISDRPFDHLGPLYGQYELILNNAQKGKTIELTIPFTDEMLRLGRRYEFYVLTFNKKHQWEKATFTVIKIGRFFTFSLPPHKAVKIYYKDYGITEVSAENNSSGGCFLKFIKPKK